MTKEQLIKALEKFDDEDLVVIAVSDGEGALYYYDVEEVQPNLDEDTVIIYIED